jgi:5-methylthioadenosine/S-adenosylhomocysteine deaminase
VLQKLIAIGGAAEQESYEIQVKARIASEAPVLRALDTDEVAIIRAVHYHQYDTYFFFDDPEQGRLRYREDEVLDDRGQVVTARARLTLTGPSREEAFGSVLLFRSRFFAPAHQSVRFYREYFKPARERDVEKDRRRWLVAYRGVQFYVHLDRLLNPEVSGWFVEVKSRTWSRRDAQDKAAVITALLAHLGARPEDAVEADYVELR